MLNGFKARCSLAMARLLEPINAEEASDHAFDAYLSAQDEGYHGFDADDPMPAFFVDEPELIAAWNSGREMAAQWAVIRAAAA